MCNFACSCVKCFVSCGNVTQPQDESKQEAPLRKDKPVPTQVMIHPALQPQQIHASRLIIATNRGPVEYYLSQGDVLKSRRGAGGMVTALIDAGNRMEVTWVAMAMTEGDRLALKEAQQRSGGLLESPLRGQKMHLRYVAISKSAYRKHYEGFSNQILWFLQHYLYNPDDNSAVDRRIQDAWTNGYCVANQAIADAVNAEIDREDTPAVVMLHDYHLYLAPALIRKEHPSVIMQQFIHIPWPDVRCWHFLPSNITHAIYTGLIGNDIIGFQTERDARNFLEGARTLLEGAFVDFEEGTIWWQGRRIQVRAYPISISVAGERRVVESTAGKRAAEKILPSLVGKKTIMRVDRIDPTKNIVRGFQAYAQMLEEHSDLLGKVSFLAFLVPSRQGLPRYQRYNADVLKIIEEINQKYGLDEWKPVQAFFGNDRTRSLAAMQFYDVLLVNPIIDGMNLVAKEGAVVNQRNGVLVLSRTAGTFQQLGKASIPTSPTDIAETAQALYKALTLPDDEKAAKAKLARQVVERNDLNAWLTRQIRDINELLDRAAPPINNQSSLDAPIAASVG
jgi:trehalose 6-phosphate synthase